MSASLHLDDADSPEEVYWKHVTDNFIDMAREADLYAPIWQPETLGITTTTALLPHLEAGYERLITNRSYYKQFNGTYEWECYDRFVAWVRAYSGVCRAYPGARVSARP